MYIYRLFCIHQLKRDAFALCALILIFMLNCALILQRQVDKISNPDPSCNHDAADAYILEIPEELNESLVHDTANTPILEIPEEVNETIVYGTANTSILEIPEDLNETIVSDTATPDTDMRIAGFYHLAMFRVGRGADALEARVAQNLPRAREARVAKLYC